MRIDEIYSEDVGGEEILVKKFSLLWDENKKKVRNSLLHFLADKHGDMSWADISHVLTSALSASICFSIAEENKKSGQKKLINREVFIDCFCDALKQDFYANSSKD